VFYLDTSAIVPLFLDDAHTSLMQPWASAQTAQFLISEFAALEFAAVISRRYRMRHLDRAGADQALADFDAWQWNMAGRRAAQSSDMQHASRLARNFDLRLGAPDSLHLAIAIADGMPLVTLDQRLAAAALKLKHPVIVPQA
jgi:uncharacterized protein